MRGQVILINGGATFRPEEEYLSYLKNYIIDFSRHGLRTKSWLENLEARLGSDFQIIRPEMPNRFCARYVEWKTWFEKFFPFLNGEIIFVGYGLGGTFLVKYLAQHDLPQKVKALFLIAAPFEDNPPFYELGDFTPPNDFRQVVKQAETIVLYHSRDDRSVPFRNMERLKNVLPKADLRIFEDRGHFMQSELPELVRDIQHTQL